MYKWLIVFSLSTMCAGLLAEPLSDVRDPTTPLEYRADRGGVTSETEWVLDSVLISAKRKLAIINGETLREGQTLPGSNSIIIQRILPQTVVLQQGEKTWVLKMSPSVRH
ncbi:MAG: hypothetical protein B0W54_19675 [Cellvibrio sp. 79]|nr:MAG: hypothetical protein B0W54_19675 [Cellvibrio sp. 79]